MCRELRFAQLVELVRICRRKVEVIVIQDSREGCDIVWRRSFADEQEDCRPIVSL